MATNESTSATADVAALFKAREAIIQIVSCEEERVERAIFEISSAHKAETRYFSVADGVVDVNNGEAKVNGGTSGKTVMLPQILKIIREDKTRCVWVLRDFPPYLAEA